MTFERAPDVPQYVRTDAVKLRQVLMNLLSNAMKFTEKGEIQLSVDSEQLSGPPGELNTHYCLLFTVKDTGPGIPAEELDALFDAFVKTKVDKGWHAGAGLGLALSHQFVRLMGGELSVTSETGRGTVFSFTIPCERRDSIEPCQSEIITQSDVFPHEDACSRNIVALSSEALSELPSEMLNQLEQAATSGDMDEMECLIDAVCAHNSDLADALAVFADEFEYGKILKYIRDIRS